MRVVFVGVVALMVCSCGGAWKNVRVTQHLEEVRSCELVAAGLGYTGDVIPQKKAQKQAVKFGADTILIQRSTEKGIAGDGYRCRGDNATAMNVAGN